MGGREESVAKTFATGGRLEFGFPNTHFKN